MAGIRKAPMNICLIHLLPVKLKLKLWSVWIKATVYVQWYSCRQRWRTDVAKFTSLLCVQTPTKVAVDRGGSSVNKNGSAQHWSSPRKREKKGCISQVLSHPKWRSQDSKHMYPSIFTEWRRRKEGDEDRGQRGKKCHNVHSTSTHSISTSILIIWFF